MNDPPPADDSGFYYYYYPVEEGGKVKDKGKGGLGYKDDYYKCSEEKVREREREVESGENISCIFPLFLKLFFVSLTPARCW